MAHWVIVSWDVNKPSENDYLESGLTQDSRLEVELCGIDVQQAPPVGGAEKQDLAPLHPHHIPHLVQAAHSSLLSLSNQVPITVIRYTQLIVWYDR